MKNRLLRTFVVAATALATAGVAVAGPALASPRPDPSVVRTENGLLRGTVTDDVRVFQGVPYAAPPVGALRFGSPRPASDWKGVRDATKPSPACAQAGDFIGDKPSVVEDCLYANVTTPFDASPKRKKPVMVWIHGGGFQWGSGAIYNADRLASKGDVVVVTFNYRLNVFGFLSHPALDGGVAKHKSGNLGVEDQQALLRWVRSNAASFGGDPRNVTIFGESAGAQVSCTHLTAPGSRGLFDRVIMQSGPCTMNWPYGDWWRAKSRPEAEKIGLEVAKKAGCDDPATAAACLRSKTPAELLKADNNEHGHGPAWGGGVIPNDPAKQLAAGRIAKVPVMHGITRDEHVTFQVGMEIMTGGAIPPGAHPAVLGQFTGLGDAAFAKVVAKYPLSAYAGSTGAAMSAVLTDWAWACPTVQTNKLLAKHTKTFAFEFADRTAPWFGDTAAPVYPTGAFHAGELQYLFGGAYAGAPLSPTQTKLSDAMISYWTAFAHDGDPNGPRTPYWPRYRATSDHVQALATGRRGIRSVDLAAEHNCSFWSAL
ncbi:carboxylesterase/lipase family protein [Tenggerimyces flavus]|uniref:Carboxylic ester hydrolase n=1 Tax=Tenggerimyces flavus TaxID=1708749 RepID=A0ABV7YJD9_9ACTN|nr:carboxylesterase/lipase family protein [Tenggerimyces flavus]MBM7787510.1 para-nitrobenzyl esterase [Tenggerimyces flavus]